MLLECYDIVYLMWAIYSCHCSKDQLVPLRAYILWLCTSTALGGSFRFFQSDRSGVLARFIYFSAVNEFGYYIIDVRL